jgi:hypothetical protein
VFEFPEALGSRRGLALVVRALATDLVNLEVRARDELGDSGRAVAGDLADVRVRESERAQHRHALQPRRELMDDRQRAIDASADRVVVAGVHGLGEVDLVVVGS